MDKPRFVELIRQMRIGVSSEAAAELFTMLDCRVGVEVHWKHLQLLKLETSAFYM